MLRMTIASRKTAVAIAMLNSLTTRSLRREAVIAGPLWRRTPSTNRPSSAITTVSSAKMMTPSAVHRPPSRRALQVVAITSAAVAIVTALLAALFLRGATGEPETQAQLPCEPAEAHV
jgi:hypothetical protein